MKKRVRLSYLLVLGVLISLTAARSALAAEGNGAAPEVWQVSEGIVWRPEGESAALEVGARASGGGTLSYQWYGYNGAPAGAETVDGACSERLLVSYGDSPAFNHYFCEVTETLEGESASARSQTFRVVWVRDDLTMTVEVLDQAGEGVAGAEVLYLYGGLSRTECDFRATADRNGAVRFQGLPLGSYRLEVCLPGSSVPYRLDGEYNGEIHRETRPEDVEDGFIRVGEPAFEPVARPVLLGVEIEENVLTVRHRDGEEIVWQGNLRPTLEGAWEAAQGERVELEALGLEPGQTCYLLPLARRSGYDADTDTRYTIDSLEQSLWVRVDVDESGGVSAGQCAPLGAVSARVTGGALAADGDLGVVLGRVELAVEGAALREEVEPSEVEIRNLPQGLEYQVFVSRAGEEPTLVLTVTGAPDEPVSEPVELEVVLHPGAFREEALLEGEVPVRGVWLTPVSEEALPAPAWTLEEGGAPGCEMETQADLEYQVDLWRLRESDWSAILEPGLRVEASGDKTRRQLSDLVFDLEPWDAVTGYYYPLLEPGRVSHLMEPAYVEEGSALPEVGELGVTVAWESVRGDALVTVEGLAEPGLYGLEAEGVAARATAVLSEGERAVQFRFPGLRAEELLGREAVLHHAVAAQEAGYLTLTASPPVGLSLPERESPTPGGLSIFRREGEEALTEDLLLIPGPDAAAAIVYRAVTYDQHGQALPAEEYDWSLTPAGAEGVVLSGSTVHLSPEAEPNRTFVLRAVGRESKAVGEITLTTRRIEADWGRLALKAGGIFYGEDKASAFSDWSDEGAAGEGRLEGRFSIEEPEAMLEAGEGREIRVVFTVTTPGDYEGLRLTRDYAVSVSPRPITVVAEPVSAVYGGALPAVFPFRAKDPLVGEDREEDLGLTLTTEARVGSDAGSYAVRKAWQTNDNYQITVEDNRALTILPAPITGGLEPLEPVSMLASDQRNRDAAALKAALNLPETVCVSYAGGTARLAVSWGEASEPFEARGGSYTYRGRVDTGVNFEPCGELEGRLTVEPVTATASDLPQKVSVSPEEASTAAGYGDFGLPDALTLTLDQGETPKRYQGLSWSLPLSELRALEAGERKEVAVTNVESWITVDPSLLTVEVEVTGEGAAAGGALILSERNGAGGTAGILEAGDTLLVSFTEGDRVDGTFQWYRNGVLLPGEHEDAYSISSADAGALLRVVYTPGEGAGTMEESVEVGKRLLQGTLTLALGQGGVVTAEVRCNTADYHLVWLRDGAPIPGAAGARYTPGSRDLGKRLSARAVADSEGEYTGAVPGNSVTVEAVVPEVDLRVSPGDGTATATWSLRHDGGAPVLGYRAAIYEGTDPQAAPVERVDLSGGEGGYTFRGLQNGRDYTVVLAAVNRVGEGLSSARVRPGPTGGAGERPGGGGHGGGGVSGGAGEGGGEREPQREAEVELRGEDVIVPVEAGRGAEGGFAAAVTGALADALEEALMEEDGRTVVVRPGVPADASDVRVSLDLSAVERAGGLRVETPVGAVHLGREVLEQLSESGGETLELRLKEGMEGMVSLAVAVDGAAVERVKGGILLRVPMDGPRDGGTVPLQMGSGGGEAPIPKSALINGAMVVRLEGSATLWMVERGGEFPDLTGHWARDSAAFVTARGLFLGLDERRFAPDRAMTRGMLATVLHRLEGRPAGASPTFRDVASGVWYGEGVGWAAQCGIVQGLGGGLFAPDRAVTREELAVMLARYARHCGLETDLGGGAHQRFSDGAAIAPWAVEDVDWAIEAGLLQGRPDGRLDPGGTATRGEVAALLERLVGCLLTQG